MKKEIKSVNVPYLVCDVVKPRKWFLGKRAVGFNWIAERSIYRAFPGVLVRNTFADVKASPWKYHYRPGNGTVYHIRCDKDQKVRKFKKIQEEKGHRYRDGSLYTFEGTYGKDGYMSPDFGILVSIRKD